MGVSRLLTLLLVLGLVGGVGTVAANHLLRLGGNGTSSDSLQVFHATADLVLNAERALHAERGAFFNHKRLALQRLHGTGGLQVDDQVGAAVDFDAKRGDDDGARVVGVAQGGACAETQRLLPLAQGFVASIYRRRRSAKGRGGAYDQEGGDAGDWSRVWGGLCGMPVESLGWRNGG